MAVTLTISETINGAEVSDALSGGGTGIDFGQVVNGQFCPLTSQALNEGAQILYLRHNATIDPVTNLKFYLDSYARTGFTYGGAVTAASDYNALKAEGALSDVTVLAKNNANGLASGVWMEQQYNVTTTGQFDIATARGSDPGSKYVKIFGRANQGIDEATAFTVIKESCLYTPDNVAENAPSAPVDGKIGKSDDTVLGNRSKLRFRTYLRTAFVDGGIFQASLIARFSYTA
jgi:hypothetical protein